MKVELLLVSICITAVYSECPTQIRKNVNIRFYHGLRSINNYTELPLESATDIFKTSWYDPDLFTFVFTFGYQAKADDILVQTVLDVYLEKRNHNVMLLNWEVYSAPIYHDLIRSYYEWSMPISKQIGVVFGETLLDMSKAGLNLYVSHLLGHSLGAQIIGIAGNTLVEKGFVLPWITALDPAKPGFETEYEPRVNFRSADFVSVIHTDPSKHSFAESLGKVDFWANFKTGGCVIQPGCNNIDYPIFSLNASCHHVRSVQLFTDTLLYPGTLLGSHTKNYLKWRRDTREKSVHAVLEMCVYDRDAVPGNYYLITRAVSPYGLGKAGLFNNGDLHTLYSNCLY